ncbi:radical SAM protein, partial [Acidobacteriota bacterium]
FHRDPGTAILSIGNIGCNMNCDFCQNWYTAQMKYLKEKDYINITPGAIIKEAIRRNIQILSWTYNDPVVWHEFVLETAREAKKFGLRNLYKSAFYINENPVEELLELIDIFSISLKSIDTDFYTKYCKSTLPPVLARIKQVYQAKAYLEISNLVVTGRNDNIDHVKRLTSWVLTELDENVPVHFVAFHPAYKYTDTVKTSESFLVQARHLALEMGLKNINIGNVFNPAVSRMECPQCHAIMLQRHGIFTEFLDINESNGKYRCDLCQSELSTKKDVGHIEAQADYFNPNIENMEKKIYNWNSADKGTLHMRGVNKQEGIRCAFIQQKMNDRSVTPFKRVPFYPKDKWRFLINRETGEAHQVIIYYDKGIQLQLLDLLDRAYYPTVE